MQQLGHIIIYCSNTEIACDRWLLDLVNCLSLIFFACSLHLAPKTKPKRRPNATRLVIARVLHPSEKTEDYYSSSYLQVASLARHTCFTASLTILLTWRNLYFLLLQTCSFCTSFVPTQKAQ